MKTLHIAIALYIISLASIFIGASIAKADEPQPVQDYIQCTYKPSQSDEVIVYCGTLKGGEGSVSIRICGVNYVVDVKCA